MNLIKFLFFSIVNLIWITPKISAQYNVPVTKFYCRMLLNVDSEYQARYKRQYPELNEAGIRAKIDEYLYKVVEGSNAILNASDNTISRSGFIFSQAEIGTIEYDPLDCAFSELGCYRTTLADLHCQYSNTKNFDKFGQYCMSFLVTGHEFEMEVTEGIADLLGLTWNAVRQSKDEPYNGGMCSRHILKKINPYNRCNEDVLTNTGVLSFRPEFDSSETLAHEIMHAHSAMHDEEKIYDPYPECRRKPFLMSIRAVKRLRIISECTRNMAFYHLAEMQKRPGCLKRVVQNYHISELVPNFPMPSIRRRKFQGPFTTNSTNFIQQEEVDIDVIIALDSDDNCHLFEAMRKSTKGDVDKESAVLLLIEQLKVILLDVSLSMGQKKAAAYDVFKLFFEMHVDWEEFFGDIEIEGFGSLSQFIDVCLRCKNTGSCGMNPAAPTTVAPALCPNRAQLIVVSAQNKTILTDVLTENYNTWNASMKLGFNNLFNQVRKAIWDNVSFTSSSLKITEIVRVFNSYKANNLNKQKLLMDIFIADWNGKIQQFCDCRSG